MHVEECFQPLCSNQLQVFNTDYTDLNRLFHQDETVFTAKNTKTAKVSIQMVAGADLRDDRLG